MRYTLLTRLKRCLVETRIFHPVRYKYDLSHPSVQNYLNSCNHDPHVSELAKIIITKQNEIKEITTLAKENPELRDVAESDVTQIHQLLEHLQHEFFRAVAKPERLDSCDDVILEVSAGVGGQEAMLFTSELFEMYEKYACFRGWSCSTTSYDTTEIGGVRQAIMNITGSNVYKLLKYEGGVHRVQRVPKTEKSGRIHTSTSTVAILPTPSSVDVVINEKDLKIETKRASGAGGQHVNTTESAVRITHIPTNMVVDCQTDRSQIKNRSHALKTLRARLYEREINAQTASIRSNKKLQVGSAGRSEKIRTYNYPQDRVTDHRISLSVHGLQSLLEGGQHLDNLIQKLSLFSQEERLQDFFQ
ncbi:unnamed protein product [Orchesella dallaii]|uniref:Prokaryotic-type class I peptide chain release factors domain-containing protein n=1 Tax=Orchesella dallaii TaxID=48710 RepID=A0ABP1Q464_9HEXA